MWDGGWRYEIIFHPWNCARLEKGFIHIIFSVVTWGMYRINITFLAKSSTQTTNSVRSIYRSCSNYFIFSRRCAYFSLFTVIYVGLLKQNKKSINSNIHCLCFSFKIHFIALVPLQRKHVIFLVVFHLLLMTYHK